MDFEIEQRFDAPRDAVEAAYLDPALMDVRGSFSKVGQPTLLDEQHDGTRVRLRVHYRFTGEVSGVVRRVVDPSRLSWVEETDFDAATHRTEVHIVPDHYGALLDCRMTVNYEVAGADGGDSSGDDGGETVRRTRGHLRIHVPILGAKAERAIVSGMREHSDVEMAAVARWLAERG